MPQKKKTSKKRAETWFLNGPINCKLFFCVLFLTVFGIIMIYSSSYYAAVNKGLKSDHFVESQLKYTLIGLAGMFVISRLNYHKWCVLAPLGYLVSVILIFLLLTPLGVSALGAVRWIRIFGIQFQVAEPVKLFLTVFLAWLLSKYKMVRWLDELWAWVSGVFLAGLLGVISSNMSTAMIIAVCCGGVIIVSSYWKHIKKYIIAIVIAAVAILLVFNIVRFLIPEVSGENFRLTRIRAYYNPEAYASSISIQPTQALYALRSGGWFGKGLGQSMIKYTLPEPYNDYIFAIICEELGVFGAGLLFFLFSYLLYQIYEVIKIGADALGKLLCTGVFMQIAVQAILNIAVVTNLLPTTGVTLPFISYGGASVIFLLAEIGIVLSVDSYSKAKRYQKEAELAVKEAEEKKARVELQR